MNTFPRINRLPPEVLAIIPSFLTYKDLVFSTHVCRHWRNTFTTSPSLWSSLDNGTMDAHLLTAYMNRCGDTPLDVCFSPELNKNIPFLKELVLHSSHIRKINIPCVPWSHIANISNGFDAPLPLLRDIGLSTGHREALSPFQRPFLAGATNLVSLHLSDRSTLHGTLLHFIIPTLSRLTLSFNNPRTPMVGEILEFLRTSPLIEDLRIDADVVLDASGENSSLPGRFESVGLPCLRNINLSWTTSRSQYTLLAHIRYPPSCCVSMQSRSGSNVDQPPQNVFPKLWDAFSLTDLSYVTLRMKREQSSTECTVIVKKPNGASASISHFQNVDGYISTDGDGNLVRDPKRDRDDNHVISDAATFLGKLPPRLVRKLVLEDLEADEMSNPESLIPPALLDLISWGMPDLTTLSLTRTCVSELLEVLTPPPPPSPTYLADLFDPDARPTPPPCPALKVLEMRHPSWVAQRHCPDVLALVKARKDGGVPLERVFLCSPGAPISMTAGMSLYVRDIDIRWCGGCG